MFKNLFEFLERLETGIGNGASVSVRRVDYGLIFKVYWPDGFLLSTAIAVIEIEAGNYYEETIELYLINRAKSAHPKKSPLIS